ncbi:probable BOI-related E3 ubiquitin-protein ligase 2 [Phragmites australis]|uniref:probable BOI-related E3 ubiquitin-protein ligase 2 n=1 Tax=Phragmites australis TaxID=29695 RepID=UPI002D792DB1|nr:probable BOI-related E3 ubiquitin-protein ligase 2 [Phragmites australis]
MAVRAQYYAAHAFPHDSRAIRPALDTVFLNEPAGGHLLAAMPQVVGGNTVFRDPPSDLTCNNNNHDSCCFVPRKRARVGDASACLILEGHGALLPPPVPMPQVFAPPGGVQSRVLCSGAASTSGRPASAAPVSQGLLLHLYRHSVEIDAFIRIENERLRAGLEEARRRHIRAVVSAVEHATARRLRDAESELERALLRNAELEEKLRQMSAEGQAWQGVAKSHEAVAAGLRATLDKLLQSPCAGEGASARAEGDGDAEDAQSCCFEQDGDEASVERVRTRACKSCGEADACVLLLPCRHLCLCGECEAAVDACPVCAASKNGSLHLLLA